MIEEEIIVEKTRVPQAVGRSSPFAPIFFIAFVAICIYVFSASGWA